MKAKTNKQKREKLMKGRKTLKQRERQKTKRTN